MNSYSQLTNIIDELKSNGVTPKVTKLATKKPRKSELVMTAGYRTTGYRITGEKTRGGNGNNAGGKVGWYSNPYYRGLLLHLL